ncbi:trigger factor [Selenomonas artemidis]|jgi:trigger factor|uniref:Trigger factor n=1 Tax=Selenomonas artemidis F0399 TaxID=749551 RepID=E7N2Z6_9FIRM|nr:trigger factor [Selenomonas artemidis]EFW29557.1 trigger factor [Selenomonas artemidis F0399]
MKVTAEHGENREVTLTIEVEQDKLEKASEGAAKRISARVNIPGFRKGKAPRRIVENFVGKDAILQEAFEGLAQKAFEDALTEQNMEPVTRPEIDIVTLEDGKDVVFTAKFTQRPDVRLGAYKGLAVPKEEVTVADEDIDRQIEGMRQHQGTLVDAPADAAVKNDDFVTLDFEGFVDGAAFEGGKGEDYPLQIGSGSFIPGFEDQLIGAKVGEERDVNVTFPEEYHAENLKGKDAVFKCKIRSIKSRELPELDDAFAKKASKFETLAELREDVRKNLLAAAERKAETERRSKAIDMATDHCTMEIPPVMVENRITAMIQEMAMRLEQQGMSLEQYLQYAGLDIGKIREDYRETAEKNVRTDLMLEEVAKAEGIKVEGGDLDREVYAMAVSYGATPKQVQKIIKEQGRVSDLAATVLRKKTAQFIVDNITA